MDLVDIDQVLDNLELRIAADEQLSRNAAAAAAAANPGRFLGDGASASNSGVAVGPGVSGAVGATPSSLGAPAAGKSFVGVSQVFNSLDDYRENVKSLQVDAQLPNYDWQTEAEHEDDIHKFSEQASKNNGQAIVSSSESLTTSSCSTFSSGPSPVSNGSHSEELATSPENEKPSEVQVVPREQDHRPEQVKDEDQNQDPAIPEPTKSKQTVEELAVGLSSISITASVTESQSLLPEEVTASSVLGQVLEGLSEESSPSREPETEMTNGIDVPLPILKEAVVEVPAAKEKEQPVQTEEEYVEQPEEQHPRRSQPLTFCSTMDEISDTELDSMLQEMDADDNQERDQQMPEDEKSVSASPVTEEESVRILSDEQETTSNDQMNVDNFSQASTVEFAELKQQESTPATGMGEDVASSFSSTESDSLSGRKLDGEQELEAELDREQEDASLATDALETQEQRPQRPQTLNLNGCQAESSTPSQDENPEIQQADSQPTEVTEGAAGVGVIPGEDDEDSPIYEAVGYSDPHANLGKVPPIWVPDNMAGQCMQCQQKFTMIKRRHHCRACGKVLCSVCCSQRFRLEFATEPESRVCVQCYMILSERQANGSNSVSAPGSVLPPTPMRSPNPNNPMEYCSTIPPHRQVASSPGAPPPSVIVPVGVLKKTDGSSPNSSSSDGQKGVRKRKSVMFSDGIAPGSELASTMEQQWGEAKQARRGLSRSGSGAGQKPPTPATEEPPRSIDTSSTLGLVAQLFRGSIPPSAAAATLSATESSAGRSSSQSQAQSSPRRKAEATRNRKLPPNGDAQGCYLPAEENGLPPICISKEGGEVDYKVVRNDGSLLDRLQNETLKFIIKNNFYVLVKIVNMSCCMNRWVLNFTTSGLHHMGSDELIILLEIKQPKQDEYVKGEVAIPKDLFQHLYEIYVEVEHARSGTHELAFTSPRNANFLGSREHGGFIFIRPTYQCLQGVIVPDNPYLVGVLIHRHEVPWAKVLPLRLILRLGAQYRYYPCPLISVRGRESVYGEIAQTIINFLVDFRNYSFSLPDIRGLYIHMEDRQTTVIIPKYRQEEVIKAINNASDHILAFAGNFSKVADGHLVCMQNINDDRSEMYSYSTQAINIQGQPRKITGASFFVLNEALKSSSGLSGKCSIVEDGLMVQIMPAKMEEVRQALRNQNDIDIVCGPIDATDDQSEIVSIKWVDNNRDINVGVKSPIDDQPMDGISNMRVLKWASCNYSNVNYAIRLSDIFIIKCEEWYATNGGNYEDITRIAEQLARSASMGLLPLLDLLAAAGINKLGLRVTLDQDNVGYEAGARGSKLPPLYMNALDNHLIATLHGESSGIQDPIILELIFYILNA
ncbi:zinc finger FYVE domain-containing protein 9 [Drosophila erecta]|uniref:Zinc finger FYVE domain-containing protein n=1 Tax=Drosophila erecta TaxID=7220 RepID=B3NMW3_DROER|nr:zinc finger FYVE domain-containing protein 9 [Drosophila erecta]EDV55457.1 uncharacterized protein Dere_GG22114, isoform A [Drosophila erecta]KQS62290.1 uncharacterized protein Dere_GG22114, isoform B [Drosophila erecta]